LWGDIFHTAVVHCFHPGWLECKLNFKRWCQFTAKTTQRTLLVRGMATCECARDFAVHPKGSYLRMDHTKLSSTLRAKRLSNTRRVRRFPPHFRFKQVLC
jgi:hypothetical protein